VSDNQIEVFRSGIIDKTAMNEAVDDFGMKYAIWVKYPLSIFTIITVGNIAYSQKKKKPKFQLLTKKIKKITQ
jgi:hypothetical protein